MVIAVTGAGGFIGKKLSSYLKSRGNEMRSLPRVNEDTSPAVLAEALSGVDVVINLAGAPIVSRWTKEYKKMLFDSRIITTRKIVEAINLLEKKPELFISASAVGIYAPEGEQTEYKFKMADDYLAEICSSWEKEAKNAVPFTRVAIIRLGIVLGKDGGALQRMLPLFKLGVGGKIASGRQGFSWMHITDLVRAIQFIIENPKVSGEFNFTAPEVVTNEKFTKVLAGILKRPALFAVPAFALKLIFGEGAIAVTGGQFAPPKHLTDEGFQFTFPELKGALTDIVR
jgi:uncharacterized protein